jgi:hypothetical protein
MDGAGGAARAAAKAPVRHGECVQEGLSGGDSPVRHGDVRE